MDWRIHERTCLPALIVACLACSERSPSVTAVDAPAFAIVERHTATTSIQVRNIRWVSGKGFVVDVAVLKSIVKQAVLDLKSTYVIELDMVYYNSSIMGDLPTVVSDLAEIMPVSVQGDFNIYRMTVPWDAMHNGAPVTGELTAGYVADVIRYGKGAADNLGHTSGTWLVVIA